MLRYSFGNIDGKAYGLNANEMSVYEAIGKCSRKDDARGWYADMQALADAMPHSISRKTVSRAVEKLLNLGLLRREGCSLFTHGQNDHDGGQIVRDGGQIVRLGGQNDRETPSPHTPLINNNNEMEKENTRTYTPTRDTAKPIPDFSVLKSIFIFKSKKTVMPAELISALDAWEKCTPAKKIKLIEAVKSGAHFKARLDWLISDFPEPEPDFLRGDEDGEIVQVKYNGLFKLCRRETAQLFNLQITKIWK